MRLNPLKTTREYPVLLAVTPPRNAERTVLGVENLLSSIAVPEPFSLELAGDASGVTLMARCRDEEVVRQQLSAHYPQARIQQLERDEDPLRLDEGEQAWRMRLRSSGPEYVPLRVFRDDDLLDPGSAPLIALLKALSALRPGERVVARLLLRSLGPDWSQGHQERAHRPAIERPYHDAQTSESRRHRNDGLGMAALALGGLAAFQGYRWWQAGEEWKAIALGAGITLGLGVGGLAWARWKRSRNRVFDSLLIKEKVSRIAFDADVEVVAILPKLKPKVGRQRARELLEPVAAAYRQYDHPAGLRLRAGKVRPLLPDRGVMHPAAPGLLRGRGVLGVREAAALWHPPGARDETPLVARSGAKVLLPSAREVSGGALVGATTAGAAQQIRFPDDLTRRHHLYTARTRMGKSTLMQHLVVHRMDEKAAGRDGDAIVVVDPHADLVESILERVPESLVGQVRLVDLAAPGGFPGINLLDTRVFADRDRTADSVVRVARGLWEQWGPRMQSILEQTVKTLHEANDRLPAGEQYTILDGLPLLSDDDFRAGALEHVSDPYLLDWWARDFGGWRREYRAEALAPVQTRLSYYASSKRARAILGQPRSTIDLRRTIVDGGVLLVSTAQGAAGRDVAALVGSSVLNLVDAVIREQGELPPEQRLGALVVVDEMQSMPGVDYESMLSELGKFGASLVLATQSLAKLADLSQTMRDTVLANVGCLAVFQVAGNDARQLVWELGKDRISEEDIVSLPVHHCYVRATVGTERMPTFSMMVRKPEPGDPETAARIRAAASSYLVTSEEIAARLVERRRRVEEFRAGVEALREGEAPKPNGRDGAPRGQAREKQRSKHFKPPGRRRRGARPVTPERDLLQLLAAMPLLDRLEIVAVSGWSRGAVYGSIAALEQAGLAVSVPHASELIPPTRRYCLTAAGLRRLAGEEDVSVDTLLRLRPVSEQWRRILLQRLDAVATIYRLASAIANVSYPIRFRWYRAMPMDAAIKLPDGRTVAVVRQGHTADRTAFAKRLWRLREGPRLGAFLLLTPDELPLRHTARLMAGAPAITFLTLERDAVSTGADARIWSTPSGSAPLSLDEVLSGASSRGAWPEERPHAKASLPRELPTAQGRETATWLLPALLGPQQKHTLDLLSDWPWITPQDLGELLGVSRSRVSQLVLPLQTAGLVTRSAGLLALGDRGLALLARRDRAAIGLARKRWSATPLDPSAPSDWRNVSGRRSRQLLRNVEHTTAVHGFVAALATQARGHGWEIVQLDPPHRASRYFRHGDVTRAVHPDAFGVLRHGDVTWPFFLEWERRAVRPVTMAARLAPYLRYYASRRPTDDHGVRPAVLVVLRDEIAADHFLRVARREMDRSRVKLPLWVSHEGLLDAEGPFGGAWRTPHDRTAAHSVHLAS